MISDVHLGTASCQAGELLSYLNSINPGKLILNGGLIAMFPTGENYFPKSHFEVIKRIIEMASKGTSVFCICGNNNLISSKLKGLKLGNIHLVEELELNLDGKKAWFVHGDTFNFRFPLARAMAKSGKLGFKFFKGLNRLDTRLKQVFKIPESRLKKGMENKVKFHVKPTANFELTVSSIAIAMGYKYVVCGHNHQPDMRRKVTKKGICLYLNSGDWIKNLTALEYKNKRWDLYRFQDDKLSPFYSDEELKSLNYNELLASIMISGKH